jgi:hypothetical protein
MHIDGEGESTGTHESETGIRTSALKFWSSDPKSLIEEGSGYWRYIPVEGGASFLTWYDYRTRFGILGRALDLMIFRFWIGWATAWSFDRLRLWIEEAITPEASFKFAAIHAISRLGTAFVWLWQGIVPKLIFRDQDEQVMSIAAGLSVSMIPLIGWIEVLIGVCGIIFWRRRSYFYFNLAAMIVATAVISAFSPAYLAKAFNPIALNVAMALLSTAGWLTSAHLPTASKCQRKPREKSS